MDTGLLTMSGVLIVQALIVTLIVGWVRRRVLNPKSSSAGASDG